MTFSCAYQKLGERELALLYAHRAYDVITRQPPKENFPGENEFDKNLIEDQIRQLDPIWIPYK